MATKLKLKSQKKCLFFRKSNAICVCRKLFFFFILLLFFFFIYAFFYKDLFGSCLLFFLYFMCTMLFFSFSSFFPVQIKDLSLFFFTPFSLVSLNCSHQSSLHLFYLLPFTFSPRVFQSSVTFPSASLHHPFIFS